MSGKMSRCLPGAPGEESCSRMHEGQRREGLETACYSQSRAGVGTWGQRGMAGEAGGSGRGSDPGT